LAPSFRAKRGISAQLGAANSPPRWRRHSARSEESQRNSAQPIPPYHRRIVEMAGGSSTAHARASRAPLGMTTGSGVCSIKRIKKIKKITVQTDGVHRAIIHYSLFIIHYSLFIIHYSLFIVHYFPLPLKKKIVKKIAHSNPFYTFAEYYLQKSCTKIVTIYV
jgi:hypothetical protein